MNAFTFASFSVFFHHIRDDEVNSLVFSPHENSWRKSIFILYFNHEHWFYLKNLNDSLFLQDEIHVLCRDLSSHWMVERRGPLVVTEDGQEGETELEPSPWDDCPPGCTTDRSPPWTPDRLWTKILGSAQNAAGLHQTSTQ